MRHPIAISLSPNVQADDVVTALKILFQPWKWKAGTELEDVRAWLSSYFSNDSVCLFNSGRSSLLAILEVFNIGVGDEVIVQAFTCVAVPEPILWRGAKPVYADVDKRLNLDVNTLESRINDKTKAIIVQHTFGVPANIDMINKIAQKHKVLVIEDCAHALGATYRVNKVGTLADASFFSFGRDKVISSVFGGAAMISSKYEKEKAHLKKIESELSYPGSGWIVQQVLHPILFSIILPLYNVYIGKLLLFTLLKAKILSKPIYSVEYEGNKPHIFPRKYPNALARMLKLQLSKLEQYNSRRIEIAEMYIKNLSKSNTFKISDSMTGSIYLRFNVHTDKRAEIFKAAIGCLIY